MDEKALTEIIMQKIRQWYSSQEGQTDGYIYEDTFVKMIDEIGTDILQASIGPLPENISSIARYRSTGQTNRTSLPLFRRGTHR